MTNVGIGLVGVGRITVAPAGNAVGSDVKRIRLPGALDQHLSGLRSLVRAESAPLR